MDKFWNSALLLLIATGLLLGLTPIFGKMAATGGIQPVAWAWVISAGAGAALATVFLLRGGRMRLGGGRLRYFFVTAAISYAFPNALLFAVIPHLGAGYASILFTLSPIFTLVISLLFGLRRPNLLGVGGILIGFAGALLVTVTKSGASGGVESFWALVALAIPLSLAAGNVYRTLDWPKEADPLELAAGSHLASALLLFAALLATGNAGAVLPLAAAPALTLAQVAAASVMFAVFFRLQAVGGPVYLSQIGYVAAAVALLFGVSYFGERYAPLTWAGAGLIAIGVAVTTLAQRQGR